MKSTSSRNTKLTKYLAATLGLSVVGAITQTAQAATITKANNTTDLATGGSWGGGVAPVPTDLALFDSTLASGNSTVSTATLVTWGALSFTTINAPVDLTFGGGLRLTGGANGGTLIDMSAASADVTINGSITLSANNRQIVVASGRTLTLTGSLNNSGGTKHHTFTGGGTIVLSGNSGGGGTIGATNFAVDGGTTLRLTGSANQWGSSFVNSGVLEIGTNQPTNNTAVRTITLGGGSFGGGTLTNSTNPTLRAVGGARSITNNLALGSNTTGNATIDGSNALTINGALINSGANRTLTVNNSALTTLGNAAMGTAGEIRLSEHATSARTMTINGSGNVILAGSVTNGSGTGASSLSYAGTGTLTLGATSNSYTGATSVSSGTMLVNGTLATSGVSVTGTGTFGGTGSTTAAITVGSGGTFAPGASIESQGFGGFQFDNGSSFEFELDSGALAGLQADLAYATDGTTQLDLNGTVTLTLSGVVAGFVNGVDKLTLISYSGAWNNGLFTLDGGGVLADDSTFTALGRDWLINYNDLTAGTNFLADATSNGTSFVTISAVPEPTTWAMMLGGLGTLLGLQRRRRRS
jgi:autotransporter-associated beta strand protein